MNLGIGALQILVILLLILSFILPPTSELYFTNNDNHYERINLQNNSAISDRNIALWSERELSRLLNMFPPVGQQTEAAFNQILDSFSDHKTASQFFIELNKIDFFDHLVTQKQHSIFAPTQETVVITKWREILWIVQTKGLLTYRSTEGEMTIKLIFQMNIKIDERSGKKRFISGRLKRLS